MDSLPENEGEVLFETGMGGRVMLQRDGLVGPGAGGRTNNFGGANKGRVVPKTWSVLLAPMALMAINRR